MDKEEYVAILKTKLDEIREEINSLRNEVRDLFAIIETRQEQSHHILELLASEGYEPSNEELIDAGEVRITDLAEISLKDQQSQESMHYKDLAEHLQSQGHFIPGKEPAANLLSQISRDPRFVRVSPGTYGLAEWGLKPTAPKKARKKRRKS